MADGPSSNGVFEREFSAAVRIMHRLDELYRTAPSGIDKKLDRFSKCLERFTAKYPSLILSLDKTPQECMLGIAVKEESLKACYENVLSSLNAFASLGAVSPGEIEAGNTEGITTLLGEDCPRVKVLLKDSSLGESVLTLTQEVGMVKLFYDPKELENFRSPLRRLITAYASREQGNDADLLEELRAAGFASDLGNELENARDDIWRIPQE